MARFLAQFLVGLVVALSGIAGVAADAVKLPLQLTVAAGQRERIDALVEFRLPASMPQQPLRLVETTGGKETPVAAQLDSQAGGLWWVARGSTAAGAKRTYRLDVGKADAASGIVLTDSERAVEARLDGKPLLRYSKTQIETPEGMNPRYGRSAHLHPVWTPGGAIVTDELPPDHLHQSGIFLAFTKTKFEGRDVDFWNLAGGKGRVRFKELKSTASGPVYGQFRVEHEHVDLTAGGEKTPIGDKPGEGKVALVETWDVRIWNAGFQSGYWILDIASRAKCASDSPLILPEYHYGGMAIRAARPWTPQQVRFLTSEADERIKGNHTRPRWCDVSGAVDGRPAGITLMTHPSNFRFPEPLRIHPTMPYMVYTPSFLGDWEIGPGKPYESRYRFIVHDGELGTEVLERLWKDFAEPLVAVAGG